MHINHTIDSQSELAQADRRRRDTLSRAMCITVCALLLVFALKNFITGPISLGFSLLGFAAAKMLAYAAYRQFKKLDFFCYYLVTTGALLCLFLAAHGATDNSGLMWVAVFPSVLYNLLRVKIAACINTLLVFCVVYILFTSNPFYFATYAFYVKIGGTGALLLASAFTFFQARERELNAIAVNHLNHELHHIASTDELTGLANRRDMSLRLEFECKRVKRSNSDFALILCDIDYFKKINDSFGHSEGDKALQAFAKLLTSSFRDTDKVGRWGGEEFLVILPNTNLHEAISLADKVRKSICQASLLPNTPNRLVTMSAGISCSSQSHDMTELLGIADSNLYTAKNSGRNRVSPEA
ncbi:GGDEF domain-containing protein [Agaribacterium sp. ZY112]|uniref:GGDEF domain-containing protein n=1 Tax=Agaribacterium sp. ZY112 TaxID=3233574 RepID=UPI0035266E7C